MESNLEFEKYQRNQPSLGCLYNISQSLIFHETAYIYDVDKSEAVNICSLKMVKCQHLHQTAYIYCFKIDSLLEEREPGILHEEVDLARDSFQTRGCRP